MNAQNSIFFGGLLASMSFVFFKNETTVVINQFDDNPHLRLEQSANPSGGKTGAPGENSCVQCHSGSTLQANGVIDFTFSGNNNMYVPNETYDIEISSTGNNKNGFQMTALRSNNTAAGTFTAGQNSSLTTTGGRNYIRHSASNGISSWLFQWNAPEQGTGDVTFYYAYNRSNSSGNDNGDAIYLGNFTITEDIASAITETNTNTNNAEDKLVINQNNRNVTLAYELTTSANIYVYLQDLQGKQIDYHNFGLKTKGVFAHNFELDNRYTAGIYLVTVFIDNKPYTKKIIIE